MVAELVESLNALAGTTNREAAGAANVWAGTTQLELIGALNAKAGNDGTAVALLPRELDGVCNQLADTVGLSAQAALDDLAFGTGITGLITWVQAQDTWALELETWRNI